MQSSPAISALFLGSLSSARLLIRPLTQEDGSFILKLVNERGFLKNIGDKRVRTVEDAREYIRSGAMTSYERHGFGLAAVELKAIRQPIGICGLLQREGLDAPDLGYALLEQYWSRGYASEAAKLILDDALHALRLHRILAITSLDNPASERVLERLGFAFKQVATLPGSAEPTKVFEWADE